MAHHVQVEEGRAAEARLSGSQLPESDLPGKSHARTFCVVWLRFPAQVLRRVAEICGDSDL